MDQAGSQKFGYIELEKGGTIKIEFYPDSAPNTVANFEKLANSNFYNGLAFHRVVPDFVVQGGDPNGNGTGGPGYRIRDEVSERKHETGTLAMAKTERPDSAGSQFYICLMPLPDLDGQYTVFGKVIDGMELVGKIQVGDKMATVKVSKGD